MEPAKRLLEWYGKHARELPWRTTRDPYRIWVSEIILQQTRVEQGRPYYQDFIDRFPDVYALAGAHEDTVMRVWQGLGYYSRARHLQTAARMIVHEHHGRMPATYEELLKLPGIGDYTAAAVASIAFGQAVPVLDGNAIRVYARFFNLDFLPSTAAQKEKYKERAQQLMDADQAGTFNQAIMELGAQICLPRMPACDRCPLAPACYARKHRKQESLPPAKARSRIKTRNLAYLLILQDEHILLRRRSAGDVWQGLYELPLVTAPASLPAKKSKEQFHQLPLDFPEGLKIKKLDTELRHRLTHQELHISFYQLQKLCRLQDGKNEYRWVSLDRISEYPFPKPLVSFLRKHNILDP